MLRDVTKSLVSIIQSLRRDREPCSRSLGGRVYVKSPGACYAKFDLKICETVLAHKMKAQKKEMLKVFILMLVEIVEGRQ